MLLSRLARSGTFRSLQVRNFRLYFVAQLISQCGTWMQSIALGWLVLELSHNRGVAVGVIVAVQYLPTTVLGAWSGLVADRVDKRLLLLTTQVSLGITSVLLGIVTITGVAQLWMVALIAALFGVAFAFDNPVRQTFVVEMVGEAELSNAVSLNSSAFQLARLVGPALAGVVIATLGTGPCFIANGASYLALVVAIRMMRPEELFRSAPVEREPRQLRDGFRYVWSRPVLRSTILLMAVFGTFALNQTTLLPLLAKLAFHGGPATLAFMAFVYALGSLAGALTIAHRETAPTDRAVGSSAVVFAATLGLVAVAPSLLTVLPGLFLCGLFTMRFAALANSLLQLAADPTMRGRVMGLWALTVVGSTPIGGPIIGAISQLSDPRVAAAVCGVLSFLAAGAYVRSIRRGEAATTARPPVRRAPTMGTRDLLRTD